MKSKKFTYILIGAVTLVWGLIAYRLWGAVGADSEPDLAVRKTKEKLFDKKDHQADTVRLVIDYPDPFHRTMSNQKDFTNEGIHLDAVPLPKVAKVPKASVDWSSLRYIGYIKGQVQNQSIAILSLQGIEFSLTEGQSAHDVHLKKLMPDSVLLTYHGEKKYVKIN